MMMMIIIMIHVESTRSVCNTNFYVGYIVLASTKL